MSPSFTYESWVVSPAGLVILARYRSSSRLKVVRWPNGPTMAIGLSLAVPLDSGDVVVAVSYNSQPSIGVVLKAVKRCAAQGVEGCEVAAWLSKV